MYGLGRKLRGESGQAAVLIAILCGLMIVVVAMTSNMGKVVTEKMAMQNAVDLAAYSGAATQAGHLNKMRKFNQQAWQTAYDIRYLMESDIIPFNPLFYSPASSGPVCPTKAVLPVGMEAPGAKAAIKAADLAMKGIKIAIIAENAKGYFAAEQAAREAANMNYKGSGAVGKLTPLHSSSGTGMMNITDEQIEVSYHGWCNFLPYIPYLRATYVTYPNDTITSWQFKDDRGSVMYAAKIDAAPKSPFMDVGAYFTPQSCKFGQLKGGRCSLEVYAVAQVYHGKLGSILNGNGTRNDERPSKWDDAHSMPSTKIDGKGLLDPHKVRGGSYDDYKVRFIGIFENEAKLIGSGTVVKSRAGTYGGRMQH